MNDISYFDKCRSYDGVPDHGIVLEAIPLHEICVQTDTNVVMIHEVSTHIAQSCVGEEDEGYVSNDESEIFDLVYHQDASYEGESDSCIPQLDSKELNVESGYSSESGGSNSVAMSSYE